MKTSRTVRLRDIAQTGSGTTPSREQADRYYGGSIPWVKSGELRESTIFDSQEKVTEAALTETSLRIVPAGAVLVAMYGATVGRVGILGIPATTNQAVCHVVPDPSIAFGRFLFYALRDKITEFLKRAAGGAQPNINQQIVASTQIALPPLAEQQRIAAILDHADALRAQRQNTISVVASLFRWTFDEMFGDPVTNPQKWPMRRFEDVSMNKLGKMLDEKQRTHLHPRPYMRNANVQWHKFDLADVAEMDFDPTAQERFRLKDGDLLLCEGGQPGRAATWRNEITECYYQKAIHRCRVRPECGQPEYFEYLFHALADKGALLTTMATIAHLTAEKLNELLIPIPPLNLQSQFAQRVKKINRMQALLQASSSRLDALFASLQHRAFRGEL